MSGDKYEVISITKTTNTTDVTDQLNSSGGRTTQAKQFDERDAGSMIEKVLGREGAGIVPSKFPEGDRLTIVGTHRKVDYSTGGDVQIIETTATIVATKIDNPNP